MDDFGRLSLNRMLRNGGSTARWGWGDSLLSELRAHNGRYDADSLAGVSRPVARPIFRKGR